MGRQSGGKDRSTEDAVVGHMRDISLVLFLFISFFFFPQKLNKDRHYKVVKGTDPTVVKFSL